MSTFQMVQPSVLPRVDLSCDHFQNGNSKAATLAEVICTPHGMASKNETGSPVAHYIPNAPSPVAD
jgi:hypothetical protein